VLEEAIAASSRPALQATGEVVRKAASQMESEMQAARDYAHARDGEIYQLTVAKKQAEDDAAAVRDTIQEQKRQVQTDLAAAARGHDTRLAELEAELQQKHRVELDRQQGSFDRANREWHEERRGLRAEADRLAGDRSELEQRVARQKLELEATESMHSGTTAELQSLRLERQEGQVTAAHEASALPCARSGAPRRVTDWAVSSPRTGADQRAKPPARRTAGGRGRAGGGGGTGARRTSAAGGRIRAQA
jgi:hypothetical protein